MFCEFGNFFLNLYRTTCGEFFVKFSNLYAQKKNVINILRKKFKNFKYVCK